VGIHGRIKMMNSRLCAVVLVSMLVAVSFSCGMVRDESLTKIAKVGEDSIRLGALDQEISGVQDFHTRTRLTARADKLKLLDQMIARRVFLKEADALGIEAPEEQVNAEVEKWEQAQPAPEMFEDFGMEEGEGGSHEHMDVEGQRKRIEEQIRLNIVQRRLLEPRLEVSDQEIASYYEQNKENFRVPQMIRMRYMTVPDQESAEKILDKLQAGTPFSDLMAEVAKERGPENAQEIPRFLPVMQLRPEVARPLSEAAINDVIGPIRGTRGYDILQLVDSRESQVAPLESVRDQVGGQVQGLKVRSEYPKLISELREKYAVEVYEKKIPEDLGF